MRPQPFLLIGNGGGGTSLLRGLLNAHPRMEVLFEDKGGPVHTPEAEREHWQRMADECGDGGRVWGNKIPIEQLVTRRWLPDAITELIDAFQHGKAVIESPRHFLFDADVLDLEVFFTGVATNDERIC